jgi:hypothetical protein
MAKDDLDRSDKKVFGDIDPDPETRDPLPSGSGAGEEEDIEGMHGGSQHDRTTHAGSRDVTEGVTGGLGTETGGTRNLRQGTGHTGGDIGNRPE